MTQASRTGLPRLTSLGLLGLLTTTGCPTGKSSIGDPELAATTGDDGEALTSSGEDPTTSESSSDSGPPTSDDSSGDALPPASCPEWSTCTSPVECGPTSYECGGVTPLDPDGCPRPFCETDEECPTGYSCYRPNDWGSCGAHECSEFDGITCECGFGLDCNSNAHCVPEELVPPFGANGPELCGALDDPTACGEALPDFEDGRCAWYDGWQMPLGGSCDERVATGACVYVAADITGAASPTCADAPELYPAWSIEGDVITVILADPSAAPFMSETATAPLWLPCNYPGQDTTVECECACSSG